MNTDCKRRRSRIQKGKSGKHYAEGEGKDLRRRSRRESLRCQGQWMRLHDHEVVLHNKSLVKANMKLQCRINSTCLREMRWRWVKYVSFWMCRNNGFWGSEPSVLMRWRGQVQKKEEKEQNCDFANNGNVWKIHNQEDKIHDLKIKWENKRKQA